MNRYGNIISFIVLLVVGGVFGTYVLGFGLKAPIPPSPSAVPTKEVLDLSCKEWLTSHPVQPGSKFGLAISTSAINAELKVGETLEVLEIISTGSKGFQLCGFPFPPGGDGLYWITWSGGLKLGSTAEIKVTALKKMDINEKVLLIDLDTGRYVEIPVRISVR